MIYLKLAIAFALAFSYWKILGKLYVKSKISSEGKHILFIGECILLAAWVIAGGGN